MISFESALQINNILTTTVGLSASSLVIYCCITTPTEKLHDYRIIIAWHAFLAFCLTSFYTVLQIGVYVEEYNVIVTLIGFVEKFPILVTKILVILCFFLFILDLLSLSVGFVYRYSLICGKHNLHLLFTPRYICCVVTALLITDLGMVWLIEPSLDFSKNVLNISKLSHLRTSAVTITFKQQGVAMFEAFCATLFFVLFISYCIIIFTFKRMLRTLNVSTQSSKTRNLQKQLMILMFLQAFFPLIFLFIPLLLLVIFISTTIELGAYGTAVLAFFYWEPCIDPILSLCYVKPFKEKLRNLIRCNRRNMVSKCKISPAVTAANQTTNKQATAVVSKI